MDLSQLSFDTTTPADYIPDLAGICVDEMSLLELFDLFGTDKGGIGNGHYYDQLYTQIFNVLPPNPEIAEIGVACGASLRAFSAYRPKAVLHGYDIRRECENLCRDLDSVRIYIHDAINRGLLQDYDLVIDDASHIAEDIVKSFTTNWHRVRPGGFYVIEDLACVGSSVYTSQHNKVFHRNASNCRMLFLDLVDSLLKALDIRGKGLESVVFYPEIMAIKKALL